MLHNFTIDHQLNHRTIRKFKDQPLTEEQLTTLFEVRCLKLHGRPPAASFYSR